MKLFTMANESRRKRAHFTFQATFPSTEERDAFASRFEAVCKLLHPVGAPPLDNHGLLCAMLDAVERTRQASFPGAGDEPVETRSFLRNSGKN